jgi:hypothetical protein
MPVQNARDAGICCSLLGSLSMQFIRLRIEVTSFAADWQRLSGLCVDHGLLGSDPRIPPDNRIIGNWELSHLSIQLPSSLQRNRAAGIRGPSGLSKSVSYCLS